MAHVHHAQCEHDARPAPATWAPARRRPAWIAPAVTGVGLAAATAYTGAFDPNVPGHFPLCPLKYVTGLDCPACGGLRGVHALLHGDLAAAADHNVLLFVFLPVAAAAWALWMLRSLGRDVPSFEVGRRATVAIVLFLVAFMVVRNVGWLPGHDFLNSAA